MKWCQHRGCARRYMWRTEGGNLYCDEHAEEWLAEEANMGKEITIRSPGGDQKTKGPKCERHGCARRSHHNLDDSTLAGVWLCDEHADEWREAEVSRGKKTKGAQRDSAECVRPSRVFKIWIVPHDHRTELGDGPEPEQYIAFRRKKVAQAYSVEHDTYYLGPLFLAAEA